MVNSDKCRNDVDVLRQDLVLLNFSPVGSSVENFVVLELWQCFQAEYHLGK